MSTPTHDAKKDVVRASNTKLLWLLIASAFFVCAVCGYVAHAQKQWQWLAMEPSNFGDMFGLANALFSGLAFAGLIYTIVLQKEELALQRQELADTRAELHAQTVHFDVQNKTLAKQASEETFFQLLRLHNEITTAIDLIDPATKVVTTRGRDCFKSFHRLLKQKFADAEAAHPGAGPAAHIESAYQSFYKQHQADLGHYFRSLYNLVKYVDRAAFDEKRVYTNLVRAQLSNYEQSIIFYNCLSSLGREKFKPLVERYALLKHVPDELLFPNQEVRLLYSAGAFG